jgi:hypothetical protein
MIRVLGGFVAFAAVALMLTSVSAQDGAKGKGKGKFQGKFDAESIFKKIDANGDGKVSKEEYMKSIEKFAEKIGDADKAAKMREGAAKAFDKAANNGSLTLEGYKKMMAERFKAFGEKKKKPADQ